MLKNTQTGFILSAEFFISSYIPVFQNNNFPGLKISLKPRVNRIKSTAFRSENNSVSSLSHTKRTKAPRVTNSYKLIRAHNNKRESPLKHFHNIFNGTLNRRSIKTFLSDKISDNLRIRCSLKNSAVFLKLFSKLSGINNITVMRKSERPFNISKNKRLNILAKTSPGCRVSNVSDSHIPWKFPKDFLIKDLIDKPNIFIM